MTVCAAEPMRINEQTEMWIVTVVWRLDRNVRSRTWCYSNTSWTMLWLNKIETLQHLCWLINRQFYIICHLKVCPAPVLHSSKTHQHSSSFFQALNCPTPSSICDRCGSIIMVSYPHMLVWGDWVTDSLLRVATEPNNKLRWVPQKHTM